MNKRLYRCTAMGIILSVALAGCGAKNGSTDTAQPKQTISFAVSYPYYSSIEQLTERSSLIVEGTVIGSKFEMLTAAQKPEDANNEQLNPGTGEQQEQPKPYTIYDVEINKVYKGRAAVKEVIQVKQLGGEDNDTVYEAADTPNLLNGEHYVMFLETYDNSPASLLNPIQALYPLKDGQITAHNNNQLQLELNDLLLIAKH